MNKLTKEDITKQLKAIVIYEFLQTYNIFEKKIKELFYNSLNGVKPEIKQELYFIYGSKIGTYIEWSPLATKLSEVPYKEDDQFKQLTINQIIKFDRSRQFIEPFNVQLQSIQTKTSVYSFHDSAVKLIEMRNVLSHELVECNFREKHIIEKLTDEKISEQSIHLISNFDLTNMDDITKEIFSNIVYMYKMLEEIRG